MKKLLYFEGAGMSGTGGEVGNCRIRTAFKNDNGSKVYLEMLGFNNSSKKMQFENRIAGRVDHCFWILEDGEQMTADIERNISFEYTKESILNVINEKLDCSFDEVVILEKLYRVHGNSEKYNLMEEFILIS